MVQTIIPAETNGIRDKAAIVGIGETEFSWNSGRSELQLASEAIKAACDDAGIAPQGHRRPRSATTWSPTTRLC